jgi:hypothetical protein
MRVGRRCQKRDSQSGQEQLAIERFHFGYPHVFELSRRAIQIRTTPRSFAA